MPKEYAKTHSKQVQGLKHMPHLPQKQRGDSLTGSSTSCTKSFAFATNACMSKGLAAQGGHHAECIKMGAGTGH